MKRKLIIIFSVITIVMLIYSITWFVIMISISKALDQEYANRTISSKPIKNQEECFIKFSKITCYGFPFKFAVQIIGWNEENSSSKIEFSSPIYIGYDLLKQSFFAIYSGETIGRYKPLESGFGVRLKTKNHSLVIKIPLSLKLFQIFIKKKDLFEIVNFVKTLELRSDKTQIFDLVDEQKLYEEEHTLSSVSFEKTKYYTNIEDFFNNIPQRLDINYLTKILESHLENKNIPISLLLYRLVWPTAFSLESQFYIKTNVSSFRDYSKDLEINVIYAKSSNNIHQSLTNLMYKRKINDINNDIYLKINSQTELKQGFADNILDIIKSLVIYLPKFPQNEHFIEELKYIIDNKNRFNFAKLENHQYILGLDLSIITRGNNIIKTKINDFSLFSNNTGFRVTTECDFNSLSTFNTKGLIVLNNYPKLIEIGGNYFYNLSRFKEFSDESRKLYVEGSKYFFKSISDHPNSHSTDISFEYELDLNNIKKGKIGTVNIYQLIPLYYLALYRKAADQIGVGENVTTRIKELIPDFNSHQELLQQLIVQPSQ